MHFHNTLNEQIEKTLSTELLSNPAIQDLLKLVDLSYKSFEIEKNLTEHAFSINEKEYQDALHNLHIQNNIYTQSAKKLKEAIRALDPQAPLPIEKEEHELTGIITYLEKQFQKRKANEASLQHTDSETENSNYNFLSLMSHEIRTPLNAICGIAHLLLQDELLPSQLENLKALNISAENLLSLINDVLDFEKIEAGNIQLAQKMVDLRQLAGQIEMAHRSRATERGNTIQLLIDQQLPHYVLGDETRLTQILNNLVSNAVKFTSQGVITIELCAGKMKNNEVFVQFSVTDTGIGIEKEKQPFIFDQFTNSHHDPSQPFIGSGIGLAIVKKLVALHKSDIYLTSEPGRGSVFYFTIPFKAAAPLSDSNVKSDLSGIHVLLVEDVEFNILVAQKMITNWNASVDVAENGLEAISKIKQKAYDIVLMDLQMPVMDGYHASRHIRDFNDTVPIIALTAAALNDTLQRTRESGMNDYLAKPFKPAELFDMINKYAIREA